MADNRLLAEIARKNGGKLLNNAINTLLPIEAAVKKNKKSLLGGLAGAVVVRVATRSVAGAIVVGGAMLAKRLYDRRHAARPTKTPEKAKPNT